MLQTKDRTVFHWPVATGPRKVLLKQTLGKGEGKGSYGEEERQILQV
jgi:hypothetical protein